MNQVITCRIPWTASNNNFTSLLFVSMLYILTITHQPVPFSIRVSVISLCNFVFFTIKCFPGPLLLQNYIQSFIKSLLLFNQYLTGSLGLHFHKSAPLCFLGNVVVVVVIELHIANRVLYSTYLSLVLILFSIGVSARPVGPIVS